MSVQKFRSADEAARELGREGRHGDRLDRIAFMLRLASSLVQRRYPTGVRRYRTPAEADADRIAWQREHVTRLRQAGPRKYPQRHWSVPEDSRGAERRPHAVCKHRTISMTRRFGRTPDLGTSL